MKAPIDLSAEPAPPKPNKRKRCRLPPVTPLAQAFRCASEQKGRGVFLTVLWYEDGFWELSALGPSWWSYDIEHKGLRVVQVWVPCPLYRARDLARDVRDLLRLSTEGEKHE